MRIMLGPPLVIIDAVHDASDGTVFTEKSIQSKTVLGFLNLASIAFADGADGVAPGNAGFEKIHVSEELQLLRVHPARVQSDFGHHLGTEDALIAEIVNGQQALDPSKSRIALEMFAQVHWCECGLPIVQMQQIGSEQVARHADGGK